MSADNYVLICKDTNEVFEGCASNDNLWLLGKAKDIPKAIEIAEDFEKKLWKHGCILEYGIHFSKTTRGFTIIRKKTNVRNKT